MENRQRKIRRRSELDSKNRINIFPASAFVGKRTATIIAVLFLFYYFCLVVDGRPSRPNTTQCTDLLTLDNDDLETSVPKCLDKHQFILQKIRLARIPAPARCFVRTLVHHKTQLYIYHRDPRFGECRRIQVQGPMPCRRGRVAAIRPPLLHLRPYETLFLGTRNNPFRTESLYRVDLARIAA